MRIDDIRVYGKAAPVNVGPTSISFVSSITEIAEDADTTARTLIGELTVADDGLGTNTLSLSGADANSFELDGSTLYLKSGIRLNHITKPSYHVTISAVDSTIINCPLVALEYSLTVSSFMLIEVAGFEDIVQTDPMVTDTGLIDLVHGPIDGWSPSTAASGI